MSLENAKKLVSELHADDELRERFATDPEAVLAEKDYGCTAEELKEALVLSRELDANELEAVTGGQTDFSRLPNGRNYDRHGNCSSNYYAELCTATVEDRSTCWTDDWCLIWDSVYHVRYESTQDPK